MENTSRPSTVRATTIIARSMYRELRRARYSQADVLRFVNEIVELLTADAREPEGADAAPRIVDAETGLHNARVILDILQFEVGRAAREHGRRSLVAMCFELTAPTWARAAVARALQDRLAAALRISFRATDSVGRLGPNRYLVVLPECDPIGLPTLGARVARHVFAEDSDLRGANALHARQATWNVHTATSAQLLAQCLSAKPTPLDPSLAPVAPRRARRGERHAAALAGRRRIVLALGGGAARAMAHVGVVRALRAAGIEIVGVAGTSAGAIVGAMLAGGMPPDEILERFARFPRLPLYRTMRRSFVTFRSSEVRQRRSRERYFRESSMAFLSDTALSAISAEQFAAFIEAIVGPDCDMAALALPFAAAATDLSAGRPVVLTYGSVHAALMASSAVPGLFPPQRDGARTLIDGAAVCEVPVDAAQQLKLAAPTLAVHLERPLQHVASFSNSAEIAVRVAALVHAELVREQLRDAPLLVNVPVHEVPWLDLSDAHAIAELGERAAAAVVDEILASTPADVGRAPAGGVAAK